MLPFISSSCSSSAQRVLHVAEQRQLHIEERSDAIKELLSFVSGAQRAPLIMESSRSTAKRRRPSATLPAERS